MRNELVLLLIIFSIKNYHNTYLVSLIITYHTIIDRYTYY